MIVGRNKINAKHHIINHYASQKRLLDLVSLQRTLDIMQTVLVPVRFHQLLILSDPFFFLQSVPFCLGLSFGEIIGNAES
jgi:hypothetical protein